MGQPTNPGFAEGLGMAKEEVTGAPVTHDVAVHEHDYSRFIRMLKIGAIISFVFGMTWMLIVKAYW
jgi:hypothetical protein